MGVNITYLLYKCVLWSFSFHASDQIDTEKFGCILLSDSDAQFRIERNPQWRTRKLSRADVYENGGDGHEDGKIVLNKNLLVSPM